ncbi:MAG: hypothetical protein IIC72_02875 [Acidobacteria bacterium]|nr:hypothetical protein [Acidobacteriota bacterium]
MREITFILGPERAAAEIWEMLGQAEISIEASCTYPTVDGRNVRVVVADSDVTAAKAAALEAGFGPIDENEVLLAEIEMKPGSLGALARRVADTGAKLQILYMARGNRVVVGADDLEKAASVV